MNRVKLKPLPATKHSQRNEYTSFYSRFKRKISSLWHRSQIGHRSEYSVERLLAFRDYYQRTSLARAVVICVVSPLPALLVALAIDSIPLRPPSDGWRENYAVWIRLLLAIFAEALGVALQVRGVIVPGAMSSTGAVIIALGTAISSVLVTIAVAAMWKFPIPYGYVIMLNLYVLFFVIYMIFVLGPRALASSPVLRQQIKSELFIMANQSGVAVAYPIFSAVFNYLSGINQSLFIFVMPLIKCITKLNIANSATSFHEYVGPIVVFSVDLFNVYYVAICMQASKSMSTTLILMAFDGFHVLLALRAIFYRTNSVRASEVSVFENYLRDLPTLIRKEFESPAQSHDRRIRLFAPFPLPLSVDSKALMNELARTGSFANDTAPCAIKVVNKTSLQVGPASSFNLKPPVPVQQHHVAPANGHVEDPAQKFRPASLPTTSTASSDDSIQDALQALFHSEYVLLAEYVEFMVPILYALYLAVLFHLEVAAYYPHTATMTICKLKATVTNILIYAVLEVIMFGALLILLKRKFGFPPLYQLAFVLESQAPAIQGHLFLWTISILHITLVHYGADFMVHVS
ncbi:hypothetical protein F443_11638 [Phytophthora nicotianae P1569]|uniref:Uncharacterized protein n=1 Tax=Phytophthora nicotianae P1569 TaxID=1317065 RepID=V9EX06_PHYNI|nr:hypothetical protein F443_11638 [Phytophthora nicotianae P1569]